MGGPGEPPVTGEGRPEEADLGRAGGDAAHELGKETRVVGTMPDLEDRLWGVLVPIPSGELEGVTPEKGL